MRDIVATIQPEQDELVRAELEDSICVQGAPGTGKTAVGPAPGRRTCSTAPGTAAPLRGADRRAEHRVPVVHLGGAAALGEVEVQQSTWTS
jgi:hypothetical protein